MTIRESQTIRVELGGFQSGGYYDCEKNGNALQPVRADVYPANARSVLYPVYGTLLKMPDRTGYENRGMAERKMAEKIRARPVRKD